MKVAYRALSSGELSACNLHPHEGYKYLLASERKCKYCGHVTSIGPSKWEFVQSGNIYLPLKDVHKSKLRAYLQKAANKVPKKHGNKGTLYVLFHAHDAKDHSEESLRKSKDWTVGLAYIPDISESDTENIGAPKRITRKV
jgi:hypothetical protein